MFRGMRLRCRFARRQHGKNDLKLQFDDPSYGWTKTKAGDRDVLVRT